MVDVGLYRWAVLAAAFCAHALLGMTLDTTGTLHVIFLKAFNGGSGNTALATSLLSATFYAIAPVTGVLVITYSCWQIAMLGALSGGLALVLSAFVNSLTMLYVTFGVLTGIGMGMAYMPAVTIISQVFDKHRSLAFGIASSGVGIGKFVGPVLINMLEEKYGWRGAILLLGSISFNLCICSAMYYRPSMAVRQITKPVDGEDNINGREKTGIAECALSVKEKTVDNMVEVCGKCSGGMNGVRPLTNGISRDGLGYRSSNHSLGISDLSEAAQVDKNSNGQNTHTTEDGSGDTSMQIGHCWTPLPGLEVGEGEAIENFKRDLASEGNLTSIAAALSTSSLFLSTTEVVPPEHFPSSRVSCRCQKHGSMPSHAHFTSTNHCHSRQVSTQDLTTSGDVCANAPGDLCNTPKALSALSIPFPENDELLPKTAIGEPQSSAPTPKEKKHGFKWNLFLMRDSHFFILCLNNFLFAIGYALVHVHLPAFSINAGQSVYNGNFLLSIIGIASLVGKIVLGWTSQHPRLSPMSVYTITSLLTAIATGPVPACNTYGLFLTYALFFGFVSGSFGAVMPSLIVSMTTVELLPSAYGFLLIFQAAGFLLGPSVGGWLYDGTGLYASSFYFGSFAMLLASLIMLYPWYWQYKRALPKPNGTGEDYEKPVLA